MNSYIKSLRLKYRKAITHPGVPEGGESYQNFARNMSNEQLMSFSLDAIRDNQEFFPDSPLIEQGFDIVQHWINHPQDRDDPEFRSQADTVWRGLMTLSREQGGFGTLGQNSPASLVTYALSQLVRGTYPESGSEGSDPSASARRRAGQVWITMRHIGGEEERAPNRRQVQRYSDSLYGIEGDYNWQELLNQIDMAREAQSPEEFAALLTDFLEEKQVIANFGEMNVGGWGSTYEELWNNRERILNTLTRLVQQRINQ